MRVAGDGPDELAGAVEREVVALGRPAALERVPAEILRRLVGLQQHAVDLLDIVLADVADPDLAERRIEREAPRVAQAGQCHAPVGTRRLDVDREQLAELRARVLGVLARVERAAAVAEAEVEARVRAENELAAIVVLLGLVDAQQLADELAVRNSPTRVSPRLSLQCSEQAPVGGEIGVERDAEEALLGADEDPVS